MMNRDSSFRASGAFTGLWRFADVSLAWAKRLFFIVIAALLIPLVLGQTLLRELA